MQSFDFRIPTRFVFGVDRIDGLGRLASELGCRRALIVSDPGIQAAGHTARGQQALRQAGIDSTVFGEFQENPTTADVERGVAWAADFRPDLIIGLGGGSSMDCAKGINFVHTGGGCMQDYWGVGKAAGPMLPMIAVPTTAGTGSEAQSFALISDAVTHVKMACGDKRAAFRIAVLDPRLTLTQPATVTALSGLDAMSHALETYVTRERTVISRALSREAWRLISGNFFRVLDHPEDLEARGGMQWGACFAGLAIENSMLGAAHALANPLTAELGIVHGQAVGLLLPHVIRFNQEVVGQDYAELLSIAPPISQARPAERDLPGAEGLARWVTQMLERAGLPTRLRDCGVDHERLGALGRAAAQQWTGTFNPRAVDHESLRRVYEAAW